MRHARAARGGGRDPRFDKHQAALDLHLFHGAVAIFQTLGLKHPQWDARSKPAALLITAIITFTNVVIPIACVTHLVGAELPANPSDLVLDSANAESNE